jgi:uncharacterized protein
MSSERTLIDVHVHLAALPTADNGCYIAPALLQRSIARWLLRRLHIDPNNPESGNQCYFERLLAYVRSSRWTRRAVLLALDGVYDAAGNLDFERTHILISNDSVLARCRNCHEFLPGASINPMRRDAVDELDRCADLGAVLIKILPNTMGFDPSEARFRAFYRRLAELRLPLLSHSGHEFTISAINQKWGDPALLRPALDEGVVVISAHAGTSGFPIWERNKRTVFELVNRYPNYYLDSSAISSFNRAVMLRVLLRAPELQERLLYGSDYPVPVPVYPFLLRLGPRRFWQLSRVENPLDKNASLQFELGLRYAEMPKGTRLEEAAREEPALAMRG